MKSIVKERIDINLNLSVDNSLENNLHYKNCFKLISDNVFNYNKIPKKYKTEELNSFAKEKFIQHIKKNKISNTCRIPQEFRTNETLKLEMESISEHYMSIHVYLLNKVFSSYQDSLINKEDIEYFLSNGGSLRYVDNKRISQSDIELAIKGNKDNLYFVPETGLFLEFKRLNNLLRKHYTFLYLLIIMFIINIFLCIFLFLSTFNFMDSNLDFLSLFYFEFFTNAIILLLILLFIIK